MALKTDAVQTGWTLLGTLSGRTIIQVRVGRMFFAVGAAAPTSLRDGILLGNTDLRTAVFESGLTVYYIADATGPTEFYYEVSIS